MGAGGGCSQSQSTEGREVEGRQSRAAAVKVPARRRGGEGQQQVAAEVRGGRLLVVVVVVQRRVLVSGL